MNAQLIEKKAKLHVIIIGIFYLVSGIWEYLGSAVQGQYIDYFLLDIYRNYLLILGVITFLVGVGLLFKVNFSRLSAIILAWWNLFTAPLLHIWWNIYAILIKKFLVTNSWFELWIETAILILIITVIRLYIIYMLRLSKAGYVFLKKTSE